MSDKQRDAMFAAWQEKQSLYFVAQKVRVSVPTVRRYRERDDWDRRLAAIKAKAQVASDGEAARRRARWAQQGQALQKVGTSKFYDEYGKLKPMEVQHMTAGEAIKAITDGIRVEREALGEPGEVTENIIRIELVGPGHG